MENNWLLAPEADGGKGGGLKEGGGRARDTLRESMGRERKRLASVQLWREACNVLVLMTRRNNY